MSCHIVLPLGHTLGKGKKGSEKWEEGVREGGREKLKEEEKRRGGKREERRGLRDV